MKRIITLLVLVFSLVLPAGCGSQVVATVNGEEITQEELDKKINETKALYQQQGIDLEGDDGKQMLEMLKQQTLEEMINNKLLMQEAKKQGKNLTDKQIKEKVAELKKQFSSEEEFKKYLKQAGMTEKELVYLINLGDYVTRDLKPVTEAQAQEYYEQNIEQFTIPERYEVRHILIAFTDTEGKVKHTETEAEQLALLALAELKNGKDFAALAKEKSEDPGSKDNGGLYTFGKGEAVQEFETAALALKPGEITKEPVKTVYGYHIIKMERTIPSEKRPFEEVKAQIMQTMDQEAKQAKFAGYMEDVRKNSKITNELAKPEDKKSKN
ncbi:peptidylprolyl isomerase [Desulfolucanica intricata]|uniref:peptidylprolyl isomerase n=1 Tax=Desulfolucanica intricata TaxID=1285191 RepID=UPI00083108C1|nr:peptidylprolyl isomerase [Desulfolucanica intricata]